MDNSGKASDIDEAIHDGLRAMKELYEVKEPLWFKMGLVLGKEDAASKVAAFSTPSRRALEVAKYGYATLEATRRYYERHPENATNRQNQRDQKPLKASAFLEHCPHLARRRCSRASKRFRTPDGACNNVEEPWKGSALMPYLRFLPPRYHDGIQSIRRSTFGQLLPSPREISTLIHRDRNIEHHSVTLMLMQFGQFIDHDLMATAQSRGFNSSIPQCCASGGLGTLPPNQLHPSCLPIIIPETDPFYSTFNIRCMEFIRSAPSTRLNCDLGWREQLNQASSFLDGSAIYGNDKATTESIRTFRDGQIFYGRDKNQQLLPPDPPGGELCRTGVITTDCFVSTDGRVPEQPGLTTMHIVWIRMHNKLAKELKRLNPHWSDERVFQETRKIVGGLVQHITYREFLPVVVGPEVMELFKLRLLPKGFYDGYDGRVNPAVANEFAAAAFRFGHSLVQNSFVRSDSKHREIFNNVTLHEEQKNIENIWSFGSLDRLLLGMANQPSQRRDEYIAEELTNHLFQGESPFGLDLAAINIQRGRDHGLAPYTAFRVPCGLTPIETWKDLEAVMNLETVKKFKALYRNVEDIDLFSGGLSEWPVRGGLVGPTFACIIAQQFLNLRKGDRFWYESGLIGGFTPAQLQEIRLVTFAQILCATTDEIETIQPFVFLAADHKGNKRLGCVDPVLNTLDLRAWMERPFRESNEFVRGKREVDRVGRRRKGTTRRPTKTRTTTRRTKTTKKPIKNTNYEPIPITIHDIPKRPQYNDYYKPNDLTYLIGYVPDKTTPLPLPPFHLDIKINYLLPQQQQQQQQQQPSYEPYYLSTNPKRPYETKPCDDKDRPYRPYVIDDQYTYHYMTNQRYQTTKRPQLTKYPSYLYYNKQQDLTGLGQNHKQFGETDRKFVKISSVKGTVEKVDDDGFGEFREGEMTLDEGSGTSNDEDVSLVSLDVVPSDVRDDNWMVYDERKIVPEILDVFPEVPRSGNYARELPRPLLKTY